MSTKTTDRFESFIVQKTTWQYQVIFVCMLHYIQRNIFVTFWKDSIGRFPSNYRLFALTCTYFLRALWFVRSCEKIAPRMFCGIGKVCKSEENIFA
uniref:Bestrophin homolog n=1 Tax=Glossina morsitans morsitans TaxID=37546 RepID=A0ABK9NGM6_GLOMM